MADSATIGCDFLGREALLKQKRDGLERRLVGFEMIDKGVPRHEHGITNNGETVGKVTTGMFSPTTKKYLGLAFVPAKLANEGNELEVVIRGRPRRVVIVKKPFYVPAYRRHSVSGGARLAA